MSQPSPRPRNKKALLGLLLQVLCLPVVPADQQGYCDPGLKQPVGDVGYRMRGDRCEGIYVRLVSTSEE